ncbi:DUF523 domain-containing protein [Geovibrio thiophilus]|uniref:DUF523 domain-containing protein n=1 Tax=Geovibrio thiophilus TaxID=139438 RepID=A0A410K1E2_9BACT|nr:DUF523 domain-containing protein [Geovibrio thiophilus]QAR34068.1 DUF523 domain-containing protein [Geovibrio thiophilus]
MKKFLLSTCLAGENVRYDGGNNKIENAAFQRLVDAGLAVTACPEVDAGLSAPRRPCEIKGEGGGCAVLEGRAEVYGDDGQHLTEPFVKGAHMTLAKARENGCAAALLKHRSPSCGSTLIYDGTFSGVKIIGKGVTAALLAANGIRLFSEETLEEFLKYMEE